MDPDEIRARDFHRCRYRRGFTSEPLDWNIDGLMFLNAKTPNLNWIQDVVLIVPPHLSASGDINDDESVQIVGYS